MPSATPGRRPSGARCPSRAGWKRPKAEIEVSPDPPRLRRASRRGCAISPPFRSAEAFVVDDIIDRPRHARAVEFVNLAAGAVSAAPAVRLSTLSIGSGKESAITGFTTCGCVSGPMCPSSGKSTARRAAGSTAFAAPGDAARIEIRGASALHDQHGDVEGGDRLERRRLA